MALTGKFRFRKSLWGKIVLQIEEEVKPFWSRSNPEARKRRWRDATLMDLADPQMRFLIDMRFKPYLRFVSRHAPEIALAHRARDEAPAEIATPAPLLSDELRPSADPSTGTPAQNLSHAASSCESEVEAPKPKKRSRTRQRKGRASANGQAPPSTTQPPH